MSTNCPYITKIARFVGQAAEKDWSDFSLRHSRGASNVKSLKSQHIH